MKHVHEHIFIAAYILFQYFSVSIMGFVKQHCNTNDVAFKYFKPAVRNRIVQLFTAELGLTYYKIFIRNKI